jgi:UDP-glucose 4-epimerase
MSGGGCRNAEARVRILVTGGAGFIGSVVVARLVDDGHEVTVIDNLSQGHATAVNRCARLAVVDLGDREAVKRVVGESAPDATIHLAALSLVGESMVEPLRYYRGNVTATLNLLDALVGSTCRAFVLSSTAAVYGAPTGAPLDPIDETHQLLPTNVYGDTKLVCERMVGSVARATGIRSVALRYFNAAGATRELGEDHEPETHLIPNVLKVALGRAEAITQFGDDYPTPDGSAIRDYVHVSDLAAAHIVAVSALLGGTIGHDALNLGTGTGHSVAEVIASVRRTTGGTIPVVRQGRRTGDPSALVASAELARSVLGWTPKHTDIDDITRSAWEWSQRFPNGYKRC